MRTDPADQLIHPWIARTTRAGEVTQVAVAPAALVPPDGGLVVEHREHWTEVYDWTYQDPSPLAGWRASGTGEPLPAEHMGQWADRTAELVLANQPHRVLELGCGTGMLLERIAPHVTAYVGTDVAADVVARHQETARPGVTVVRGAAHEARSAAVDAALAGHVPDCVLINSVTQCFPDLAYLAEVLRTAIGVVAPGGTVVVGDVRHAGLHLRHWQDLAPDSAAERAASDRELLVDPVALASAALASGRGIGIAVHAKTLSADSELSRYRFDAVLHVDAEFVMPRTLEWTGDPLAGTGPVLLRGIPNARLRPGPHARTAARLREELAGCDAAVLVDPADPELLAIARPAAAAVQPAAELAGPGRAHEPLAAFARARVGALSRRAIGSGVQVVLPVVDEDVIAAAHSAGTAALPEGAGPAAAAAVSRLDEVALRAMADLLADGDPQVDPRHAWIVRRWHAELAANEVPGLSSAEALPRACAALGYPPAMAEFFAAAIAHLPQLLRDEVPLQALLFPDGEITTALGSYQDNLINTYLNHALAELAGSVARTREAPLRVLELGGGVGGSSRTVLDGLGEAPTDYLFTDVSRFFLDELAESGFPEVRTALLDINSDLAGHTEKHDLVIAANVLHNAVDVRSALAAVRSVLAPGGVFALIESTREHLPALVSMQFLMSPRPGESQAGSADLRAGTDRIFLTEQQWWAELASAGLRPVAALPAAKDPLLPLGQQLLVSCAAVAPTPS